MKTTAIAVVCLIIGAVAYAQVLADPVATFFVSRDIRYGSLDKVVDGDTTCYVATTRHNLALFCK